MKAQGSADAAGSRVPEASATAGATENSKSCEHTKGDTFIARRMGTFLKTVDRRAGGVDYDWIVR